ncbi:MAG: hypothetical protein ACRDZX_16715, partial [Acidimicrobiales bacterium]
IGPVATKPTVRLKLHSQAGPFGRAIPAPVFYGLAIASVGGPLGLVALVVPSTVAGVASSSGLVALLGSLAFVFPLLAWYRYSSNLASCGGLYSFVEAAAGTRVARAQGVVWAVGYFLYLPWTMPYVTYGILPAAFPGVRPYRALLTVAIPAAMVLGLVAWRLGTFFLAAAVGAAQVILVGVLTSLEISGGGGAKSMALHVPATTAFHSAGLVSLLFVCGSLPLYLGSEVRNARAVTSRGLVAGIGIGAACAVVGSLSLARFPSAFLGAEVPGWLLGRSLGGQALGDAVAAVTALSVLTLVLLEYVALTRLLHAMARVRPGRAELGVGVAFIASAALTLINPGAAYQRLATPSLVALYLSLAVVFFVYPRFRRPRGRWLARDFLVAGPATALMLYGLYNALEPSIGI